MKDIMSKNRLLTALNSRHKIGSSRRCGDDTMGDLEFVIDLASIVI